MLLVITGVLFALNGAIILCAAAIKYNRLIKLNRKSRYLLAKANIRRQRLQGFLTYFFAASYMIGVIQALTTRVNWLFFIEGILFQACALFFYSMIVEQYSMEKVLHQNKLGILRTFVNAIDRKDAYTRGHSEHVYKLVELFYGQMPVSVQKRLNLPKLLDAALLHDIGKIGVSDDILKKNDALTEEEWRIMTAHARESKRLLDDTCLKEIASWVLYHHERMDGNGYEGLPREQIPLESRVIAIADTFSALTTTREYRPAMKYRQAIEVMMEVAGTQLDSELLGYFVLIPHDKLLHEE